jgi:glycine/D-amino acid oxidase-like deaminating enzyme
MDRVRCDVAVVGAGITGALVSNLLTEAGMDTVLVDQGLVGCGSTECSTGLLLYEIDQPLVRLIEKVGETPAVRAYRRGREAIDSLEELTRSLSDNCDFVRRPSLYLASREADLIELHREQECRQHFGFDVHFLNAGALQAFCGLQSPGALHSINDAEVDPFRLTQATIRQAVSRGLRVFDQTRVTSLTDHQSHVILSTSDGQIEAGHVVFATGYFTQTFLPQRNARLHTTYAIASPPLPQIPRWPDNALMWETATPYLYLRRTADGRAIVGGEDTSGPFDHDDQTLIEAKVRLLTQRFAEMFPENPFEPEYAWAGTFADTSDGLPFIGRAPDHRQIYLALGYGGNGITFSMIAAELLRDLIKGVGNPDEAVFRFGR